MEQMRFVFLLNRKIMQTRRLFSYIETNTLLTFIRLIAM